MPNSLYNHLYEVFQNSVNDKCNTQAEVFLFHYYVLQSRVK